ncbi:MAG: exosortase-associated EpsI family protein [Verrucomicrobiaceae bacterium]|nr:exosortase-associated EpsI family protein [Verrucomicrobiaceae bacterium]
MKKFFSVVSFIVACLGIFFVFTAENKSKLISESTAVGYLKTQIPDKFMGATSVEKELGATEEVVRATEKILNVSDYLNREYTLSSGKKLTLYISYWEPAKEPIEFATTHTPDRCWVNNGWVCNEQTRRTSDILTIENNINKIKPARYGEYTFSTNDGISKPYIRYVWFWFIVDGKIYEFTKQNKGVSPYLWLKNTLTYMNQKAPEMYFIRVDSDKPLDEFRKNAEFQQLLKYLGDMILFEGKKGRIGDAK